MGYNSLIVVQRHAQLRVMAAIRVPLIKPLVIMAVQKCCTDSSSHVRRAVANALPNLVRPERPSGTTAPAEAAGGGLEGADPELDVEEEEQMSDEVVTVLEKLLGDPAVRTHSPCAKLLAYLLIG